VRRMRRVVGTVTRRRSIGIRRCLLAGLVRGVRRGGRGSRLSGRRWRRIPGSVWCLIKAATP
ncbi:MAG: hypothetical protein ACK55Z_08520, partial [bacterium]